MGSHGSEEDIVRMVLVSLSRTQPMRDTVEHLTQLSECGENFF